MDDTRIGTPSESHDSVVRERDLYRALLELHEREGDVAPLLEGVLGIVRELTGADRLYLQAGSDLDGRPPFWAALGTSSDDLETARAHLSRTIIREALSQRDVLETASALDDARFEGASSVREKQVGAVICAALGRDPSRGVLYVQGARGSGGLSRDAARVVATTASAISSTVAREVRRAREALARDETAAVRARIRCDSLIGRSRALASVLELAALASGTDSPVLLTGDSGTGKSMLAEVIARASRRAGGPFVEVNCAALPAELVESELFGAARGAHSTANEARDGWVAAAEGGTLFLDEIGELPPAAQAKLLHLTQTGTYHRLGDASPRRANVRILAATNVDVQTELGDRRLRRDLYYRLAVIAIEMPSLAARPEDIAPLTSALCHAIARDLSMPAKEPTESAIAALEARRWPGNVRELRNVLELGILRAHAEGAVTLSANHVSPVTSSAGETPTTLHDRTRAFQRAVLDEALRAADGKASVAAEKLGLSRSHLYHLLASLEVPRR